MAAATVSQVPQSYIGQKVCRTCEQLKPFTDFYVKAGNRDGYDFRCKACTIAHQTTIKSRKFNCTSCSYPGLKHQMSIPDRDGRVFCYKCLNPVYYSVDLYNQYLTKTTEIDELQSQMNSLNLRLQEASRQRDVVINVIKAYTCSEEKKG